VAIEWDKHTFTPLREVALPGEHWGLCLDGDRLIVSDGTARLRFLDVETLSATGSVDVTRDGRPQVGVNELECVDGQVWANAWPTDDIIRIDPSTGRVDLVVDAAGLWRFGPRSAAQVLSGIAHIQGDEFLLTGKEWPAAFRVRI
jgi:glutamine cyclotransferase